VARTWKQYPVPEVSPAATHTLGRGNWTVTVRVTDASGNVAATTAAIRVDLPPVAAFTFSPATGKEPLEVEVDPSNRPDPDGDGIPDAQDACPNERGAADAVPEVSRASSAVRDVFEADTTGTLRVRDDEPLESLLGNDALRRLGALMAVDGEGRLRGVITADQVGRALRGAISRRAASGHIRVRPRARASGAWCRGRPALRSR